MWFDKYHNCNCREEESESLLESNLRKYPQPLSLGWRLRHGSSYLASGVLFIIGSYQYFTFSTEDYQLAAITFILGGFGFLYSDLSEWWLNNRVGCFMYDYYKEDYEKQVGKSFAKIDTLYGSYQRAENGMNFAFSAFGSLLYFIGGFLFLPNLNQTVLGTQIFIWGSSVIFLSQSWKLYRWGCNDQSDPLSNKFKFVNLAYDFPATMVDFFAGIGGALYLIGSVYFLPDYDTSDYYTNLAATFFLCGGISFTLSGVSMQYRYYIANPPLYPNANNS